MSEAMKEARVVSAWHRPKDSTVTSDPSYTTFVLQV